MTPTKAGRIPVDPQTLPYRPCVGIMVLNRNSLVWVGRRIVKFCDAEGVDLERRPARRYKPASPAGTTGQGEDEGADPNQRSETIAHLGSP